MDEVRASQLASLNQQIQSTPLGPHTSHRAISALVVTYNRCPFEPVETALSLAALGDNPLVWCIASLVAQSCVSQIVVVDDGSTDYTKQVLQSVERLVSTPLVVISSSSHLGANAARNEGIKRVWEGLVFLMDDDCIIPSDRLPLVVTAFDGLPVRDGSPAALTLPYYTRSASPTTLELLDEIGRVDVDGGSFSSHFDAFPLEWVESRLTTERVIDPIPTQLVSGVCLFDTAALREVGGFADLDGWQTSYSDHLLLSDALCRSGRQIYHCFDPRASVLHLKFGAEGRYEELPCSRNLDDLVDPADKSLRELIALSSVRRVDTGCRTSEGVFFAEMVGLFFAFYSTRSLTGGASWARRVFDDYVTCGEAYSRAYEPTADRGARELEWRTGMRRGLIFAKKCSPGTAAQIDAQFRDAMRKLGDPRIVG